MNDTKSVTEKEVGKDDDNASIPLVPVFKGKPDRGGNRDLWSVRPLDNPTPPLARPAYRPVITDDRNRFGGDDKWNQVPIYEIWTTERYNRKHDQPVYHHRGENDVFVWIVLRHMSSHVFKKIVSFVKKINSINLKRDILTFCEFFLDPYGSFQKPQQNFIPYAVNQDRHRQHGPWQPCDCKEYPGPFIQPQQPSSNEHRKQVIDDKLERPFSKTTWRVPHFVE